VESHPDEVEPDARFTFANERTFLAWSRTALALVVAGLGIVQLLPPFPGVPWGRHVLGVPLIAFGAIVAVAAYREWVRNQRALRHGKPLPVSVLPKLCWRPVIAAAMASRWSWLVRAGTPSRPRAASASRLQAERDREPRFPCQRVHEAVGNTSRAVCPLGAQVRGLSTATTFGWCSRTRPATWSQLRWSRRSRTR